MYQVWNIFVTIKEIARKEVIIHLFQIIYFTKLYISCYNDLHRFTFFIMTPEAERFNGWAAMLGFVAAVGAYVTTGQIIPGWF